MGAAGYSAAFLAIGGVGVVLTILAFALKNRAQEQATVAANAASDWAAASCPAVTPETAGVTAGRGK